jgi:cell wall-associated NlpC family hydrolase
MSTLSLRARRLFATGVTAGAVLVAPIAVPAIAPPASAGTSSTATSISGVQARAAFNAKVLSYAKKASGVRYKRGGTSLKGFDCSGYVKWVYAKAGKKLPRTSKAQFKATKKISKSQARPGDLVFFHKGSSKGRVYHVAIYAGNGKIYHASRPGTKSGLKKLWTTKNITFGRA